MDYVKLVYSFILLVVGIMIFIAPFFQKTDERRKFINSKAHSYAFIVVIGMLLLEVVQSLYFQFQGDISSTGNGISPLVFLSVVSIIYVLTLLFYKKSYGG
ncbi:hypothetical protein [Paenisporosarcina cavernae]|uniref:Integral membrane protein n=1 Tax=Paenisporosarcina cavernae TaxID=2320858 RepID=A0A385YPW9_9BACL|nr:hypothetical protein [Paenisporosarcina cavernae]AYC28491.1 hypothetical protein D3873_00885 [Paenisporosarcina cavernae]